jgi:hypothetical protein
MQGELAGHSGSALWRRAHGASLKCQNLRENGHSAQALHVWGLAPRAHLIPRVVACKEVGDIRECMSTLYPNPA